MSLLLNYLRWNPRSCLSTVFGRAILVPVVLLVLCAVALTPAQPGGGGGQASVPSVGGPLTGVEGPIISERYILMPGDQVLVTVTGSMTFSYPAWITYEGKVVIEIPADFSSPWSLQIVDAVRISGLNLKDAQDSLARVMGQYLREAHVKLTLTTMRSGVVFVTGEVHQPGAVYASPIERVSQVVAKAGGLTPLGSRNKIQLIRDGKLFASVNIERFENNGDLSMNPFVESGDRIYVPPVSGIVTVKGAVFGRGEYRLRTSALTTEKERISEGMYELDSGERVTDLLKKAGGITPWADLRSSYVLRRAGASVGSQKIPLDLSQVLFQNDQSANIELQNDDILVVPPVNTMVYVEGEVLKPGAYLYTPNLKFDDYVGSAGGPTNNADVNRADIVRANKHFRVRNNPVVEPGDIVVVPRQGLKWWQDYLSIFSAVGMPVAIALLSIWTARLGK